MEVKSIAERIQGNPYVGRGIAVGLSPNGKYAAFAYFIMGRSENSRNRVFQIEGDTVKTEPYDYSKVGDPSLIIYNAVRTHGKDVIVTNGDQTDTIYDSLAAGKCFRHALRTRSFEPDAPNYTPRISAILHFAKGFSYEMSILKCADQKGEKCNRYFFDYEPVAGEGRFIHTYVTDGNPLPSFEGEPEPVKIPDSAEEFAKEIWENLDPNNKISLYCRYIDLETGKEESVLYNGKEVNA